MAGFFRRLLMIVSPKSAFQLSKADYLVSGITAGKRKRKAREIGQKIAKGVIDGKKKP